MPRIAQEIPKVGLIMENARLVRWLKNVGDTVAQGEPLLELETEKSIVEIEATASGLLVEQLLQADAEARVGDQIAWLEDERHDEAVVAPPKSPLQKEHAPAPTAPSDSVQGRVRSSPAARRLALENGVDLSAVTPSGPRGRVQFSDVQKIVGSQAHRVASEPAQADRQLLSPMRRALARSMTLSNANVPQFVVARALDWTSVHEARRQVSAERAGVVKLSVNDFLLHAIARSLIAFPAMNAVFHGHPHLPDAGITPARGAHVGLVVAVEGGLLVPVMHDLEQLGIHEIARRRADCVDRALRGRLRQTELEGATISLSNLGGRGPDRFTAMINPPQSAILAVGRQKDCVVAHQGGIHIRPMSELCLTVDHRIADGRLAAEYLAHLVEILESKEGYLQ